MPRVSCFMCKWGRYMRRRFPGSRPKFELAGRAGLPRRVPNWVVAASVAAGGVGPALGQNTPQAPLEEIIVTAEFFRPTVASSATRFDLPVQDTPQAISVLTADILSTFGTRDLLDIDKYVAGVQSTGNGASTNYFLGFMQARGFVLDQLSGYKINGFSTIREFQPDLAVAERIEFVKGPSSVVFGVNNYGGTVNTVLKAPEPDQEVNVSAMAGSYGTYRVSADATGPVNDEGTVKYRFITAWEDRRSAKDDFEYQRLPVYGRLQWDLGADTTIDTYVLYQAEDSVDDFGAMAQLNAAGDIEEPFALDRSIFLGDPGYNDIERDSLQAYAGLTHRFANDYTGGVKLGYVENESSYKAIYVYNYGYFNGPFVDVYTKVDSRKVSSWDAELSFGGDFEMFGRTHKLMLLADARAIRFDFTLYPFDSIGNVNQFDPDFSGMADNLDLDYLGTSNGLYDQEEDRVGVGAQALFNITDKLSVLAGLRWDHIDQNTTDIKFDPDPTDDVFFEEHDIRTDQTKDNVTPRLGVLYNLTPQVNLYASYSEGFVPQEGVQRDGSTIDPEVGIQIEAGVKGEFYEGKLGATLTGFYIERKDVAVSDPTNTLEESYRVPGREQEHKGIEVEVLGRILPNLNIIATYAYLDTEITKDDLSFDELDTSLGNSVGGAPENSGSLFLEYQFPEGVLRRLSINGGAYYVGKRPSQERNVLGRWGPGGGYPIFYLQEYTVVDLGARYQVNEDLSFRFELNNAFDEDYFTQAQVPECCAVNFLQRGQSREFNLAIDYRF
jgi:iron complex outermembrane recepter protein